MIAAVVYQQNASAAQQSTIVRLNADGSLDPSFDPGAWNCTQATAAALQSDGKVLVGGSFLGSHGYTHFNIVRLNTDGTVDSTFNATSALSAYYYWLNAICLQPDGRVLAGGDKLVRLNADGSLDTTFSTQFISYVTTSIMALAVAADGHILVSGDFNYVNNTPRSNFARLNSNGTLDTAFAPSNAAFGRALLVQPDGRTLLGNSQYTSPAIFRYNTDGSLDPAFTPPSISYQGFLYAVALQSDGKNRRGWLF